MDKMQTPGNVVQYRGWEILVSKLLPESMVNLQVLVRNNSPQRADYRHLGDYTWHDNLGRVIGIRWPGLREGNHEFAKFGHWILLQKKGDTILLQVVNEATANHMMAQVTKKDH